MSAESCKTSQKDAGGGDASKHAEPICAKQSCQQDQRHCLSRQTDSKDQRGHQRRFEQGLRHYVYQIPRPERSALAY